MKDYIYSAFVYDKTIRKIKKENGKWIATTFLSYGSYPKAREIVSKLNIGMPPEIIEKIELQYTRQKNCI